jgi:hypothetical protein
VGKSVRVDHFFNYPFALAWPVYEARKIVAQIETVEGRQVNVVVETDRLIGSTCFVRARMEVTLRSAFALDDPGSSSLMALPIQNTLMQAVHAQLVSGRGRELPLGALKLPRLMIGYLACVETVEARVSSSGGERCPCAFSK